MGNATTMNSMFRGNTVFNQDVTGWDVSKVKNMFSIFRDTVAFNQDLSTWNVSSIEDIRWLVCYNEQYQYDLCAWNELLPVNAQVNHMFTNTSCPYQEDPILNHDDNNQTFLGPFCMPCD